MPPGENVELLRSAGLQLTERGGAGASCLRFAIVSALSDLEWSSVPAPIERSLPPLPHPRWLLPALVAVVVADHLRPAPST